jgi:hypothetical protein
MESANDPTLTLLRNGLLKVQKTSARSHLINTCFIYGHLLAINQNALNSECHKHILDSCRLALQDIDESNDPQEIVVRTIREWDSFLKDRSNTLRPIGIPPA